MNPELTDGKGDVLGDQDKSKEDGLPSAGIQDFKQHKDQGSYPTDLDNDLDKFKSETTENITQKDYHLPHETKQFKRPRTVSFSEDVGDSKHTGHRVTDLKGKSANKNKPVYIMEDDDSDVPYDRGWAWMVDLGCFLLFFVYISHDHWNSVLLMDYMKEFNISVSLVTIMMSIGSICYCVATQISTGVLVTRFSIRIVTTCAAILNVGATLTFAAAPNIATFFIINFVKFTVKGITLIATLILVGFYFKRRRGLATTLGLLGVSMSFVCAPPLIRYLREEYGFRGCFLIMAGFEMHGIVAALLLRPISSYMRKKAVLQISSLGTDENSPLIAKQLDDQSNVPKYRKMAELLDKLSSSPASIPETDKFLSDPSDAKISEDEESNVKGKDDTNKDFAVQAHTVSNISGQSNGENGNDKNKNADNCESSEQDVTENIVHDNTVRQDTMDKVSITNNNNIQFYRALIEDASGKSESKINSKNDETDISDTKKQTNLSVDEESSESTGLIQTEKASTESHQIEICVPSFPHASNWSLVTSSTMGSMLNIAHLIEASPAEQTGHLEETHRKCSWVYDIFDVSILKNYLAVMVAVMYIMVNAGMFSIIYLPSYAKHVGVSSQNAALLLTVVGAMDVVGRLGFGFLADLKVARPNLIIAAACLCIGTVTHFVVFFDSLEKLIFFSVMQGLLGGAGQNLTTVLIVDVIGIQYLSKLLSMSSMFNSFSVIIQHPIQGAIIEATGNFVATFHYVGTNFLMAALLLVCEPLIRKLQVAKEAKQGLKQQSVIA